MEHEDGASTESGGPSDAGRPAPTIDAWLLYVAGLGVEPEHPEGEGPRVLMPGESSRRQLSYRPDMELFPEALQQLRFGEHWRGYEVAEVDSFLDRLAVAMEQCERQARELEDHVEAVERRVAELTRSEAQLRQTLMEAQRVVDTRTADAEERAERLLGDAARQATVIVSTAEAVSRRIADDAQRPVKEEVATLSAIRRGLLAEVRSLVAQATTWPAELRSMVTDGLAALGAEAPPPVSPAQEIDLRDVRVEQSDPAASRLDTPAREQTPVGVHQS